MRMTARVNDRAAPNQGEHTTMGFEDVSDGEGYTKFEKGANVLAKPVELDHDKGSYQGDEYFQLELVFEAVAETSDTEGRIPAWPSSKITIRDSEEHTSDLGKLLNNAGILRNVLEDLVDELDAGPELVDLVATGEKRFEASTQEENIALLKAVANNIEGKVLRIGTKWSSNEEYSVAKDFYGLGDEDPFSAAEQGDDGNDVTGETAESDEEEEEDTGVVLE